MEFFVYYNGLHLLKSDDTYFSDKELSEIYRPEGGYQPLTIFEDAVEFLNFFDEPLQTKQRMLYKWQAEKLRFASEGFKYSAQYKKLQQYKFTAKEPLRLCIVAANGSGKDSYFNAPLALYLACCKIRNKVVITSSSYQQLNTQTEDYIRTLGARINTICIRLGLYPDEPLLIKKSHIINKYTGCVIILFVTDEAGRAEGHHPFPDYPQSEVCILINEAKTVLDPIYTALQRCTFTRWIEISSPGPMRGKFYTHATTGNTWEEEYEPGKKITAHITSYDCPAHVSEEKIEADKEEFGGENSEAFRSKHLALFTSVDENSVFSAELIDKATASYIDEILLDYIHVGIDVARGGDENAFYAYQGNKKIHEEFWRDTDTARATDRIVDLLNSLKRTHGLKPSNVNMDEGNIGYTMMDYLKRYGWPINRVANQSSAFDGERYGNKGAEMYFNLRRLFEEGYIKLDKIKDDRLIKQLKSRYYKESEAKGKKTLESKKESRGKGHGSPDRGDAFVLCFSRIRPKDFVIDGTRKVIEQPKKFLSQAEIVKKHREDRLESIAGFRPILNRFKTIKRNNNHPSNIMRMLINK